MLRILVGVALTCFWLVPASAQSKELKWNPAGIGDCGGHDIGCSAGAEPKTKECTRARLGLTSVCFTNGSNHDYPPFPAVKDNKAGARTRTLHQTHALAEGIRHHCTNASKSNTSCCALRDSVIGRLIATQD